MKYKLKLKHKIGHNKFIKIIIQFKNKTIYYKPNKLSPKMNRLLTKT